MAGAWPAGGDPEAVSNKMEADVAISPHCVVPSASVGACAHGFVSWSCGGWPSARSRHFRIRWRDGGCPPPRHRCRTVRAPQPGVVIPVAIPAFAVPAGRGLAGSGVTRASCVTALRGSPLRLAPSRLTSDAGLAAPGCCSHPVRVSPAGLRHWIVRSRAGVAAGSSLGLLALAWPRVAPRPHLACRRPAGWAGAPSRWWERGLRLSAAMLRAGLPALPLPVPIPGIKRDHLQNLAVTFCFRWRFRRRQFPATGECSHRLGESSK